MDITELKSAEQERERPRQLEADLAHTNRVSTLGEMAASLAHEIKQPIAAAIASANSCMEWLAHEPPNLDRARAAAARIDKYGNRAAESGGVSGNEIADFSEVRLTGLLGLLVEYSFDFVNQFQDALFLFRAQIDKRSLLRKVAQSNSMVIHVSPLIGKTKARTWGAE